MSDANTSRVERVTYRLRESTSTVLQSSEWASYVAPDGSLIIELHKIGQRPAHPVETIRLVYGTEHAEHTLAALQDWKRRHLT